eukprot:TRINITY_DN7410_c0_g1_i1.p1 TRINITY_DN7410_c0_g1~~TRINITY_DN7410_c0_g1_i1.p1  ORF type:complete len:447 (+),score=73.46 TRINITY_DN7410_c0_g1_i1:24-1364(+)
MSETATSTKKKASVFTNTQAFAVKVVDHPTKGRTLVATKDFSSGDEILSVESVLSVPREGWGCIACCDRTCMGFCDSYRRLFMDLRTVIGSVSSIAKATGAQPGNIRMIIKFLALRAGSKQQSISDSIFELKNSKETPEERDIDVKTAEKLIANLPQSHKDSLSKDQIVELLGIVASNSHKISHIQGAGLFPLACMIEHSCKPNAHYETSGNKISVTATTSISQGQSISLNYLESYLPRQERMAEIKLKYNFDCTCELCDPNVKDLTRAFVCKNCDDGIVSPIGNGADNSSWTCEKCSKPPSSDIFKEMIDLETKLKAKTLSDFPVDEVLEGGLMHKSHYLVFRVLDHRVRLLSRIRPQMCEKLLETLLESTKRVLTPNHPEKAVYYDMLGQVKKLLGDLQGCKEAFNEAFAIREKCCGKNAPSTLHAKQKTVNPEKVEISLWYPS